MAISWKCLWSSQLKARQNKNVLSSELMLDERAFYARGTEQENVLPPNFADPAKSSLFNQSDN